MRPGVFLAISGLAMFLLAACGGGGGGGGGSPLPPAGPQLVHSGTPGQVFMLLGAAGDTIAYQTSAGVRVRNVATGADAELLNANTNAAVAMTTEYVYGSWQVRPSTNCASSCVLRWPIAGGAATVIPFSGSNGPVQLKAKGRYATWRGMTTDTEIRLYDSQTGQITGPVIRTGGVDILDYDLAIVSGSPVLYYWIGAPATNPVGSAALQRWTEAGGAEVVAGADNTNAPSSGLQPVYVPRVSADGDQVAYTAWTPAGGGSPAAVSVVVRPTSGGTPTTIGGATSVISMRDGVAVWAENIAGSGAGATADLKAWSLTRGTEVLQAGGPHPAVLMTASGFAVYGVGAAQALYTWSGASGVKLQRTSAPGFVRFVASNWIYYIDGAAIYRVSMN